MSASLRERTGHRHIELGTAVNWPMIYSALGLALVALTAVVGLALVASQHSGPGEAQPAVAQRAMPVVARESPPSMPSQPRLQRQEAV